MVGHLQTNKVKDAVRIFSLIHSVDSLRLMWVIDKEAGKIGKRQKVLIQVNVSGEESKFGIPPEDIEGFLREASLCPNVSVEGLMTIAPETANPKDARPCFRALKELLDKTDHIIENPSAKVTYSTLSMGMTNDFEAAIEEGSNMVRIGRAIFKDDR